MDKAAAVASCEGERGPLTRARREAASVWAMRARAEIEAASRFSRIADSLAATSAAPAIVTMARDAVADEMRHAELCRALVGSLGAAPPAAIAPKEAVSIAPRGYSARDGALYEVVAMSCVTETLSAALLGEMIERAEDDEVRETMHAILRDEIGHSRLGWAHLAAEHQRGAADVVSPHMPAILRGTVEEELFLPWVASPEAQALSGLGSLDRPTRLRIFVETMREVVFPGLSRFGVDTRPGEAWLDARSAKAEG